MKHAVPRTQPSSRASQQSLPSSCIIHTLALAPTGDADVWVGGSDERSEGHWAWINSNEDGTNTTIPPHHWAPDQPDNGEGDGEHCLIMQKNVHPPLADSSCERYLSFVCQYRG